LFFILQIYSFDLFTTFIIFTEQYTCAKKGLASTKITNVALAFITNKNQK